MFSKPFLLLMTIAICLLSFGTCFNLREEEKRIVSQLLANYDPTIRPNNATVEPVTVSVSMHIMHIQLDEQQKLFTPLMYFRQKWIDPRLRYGDANGQIKSIDGVSEHRIWKPDTFFSNAQDGNFHTVASPNTFVKIFPNGEVFYSIKISLALICPMTHQYYPHAKQQCPIEIESYGFNDKEIKYEWIDKKTPAGLSALASSFIQRFYVDSIIETTTPSVTLSSGTYSRLVAKLSFYPKTHQFRWRFYLPSIGLLLTSMLSFWINPKSTLARTTLVGSTSLLMILVLSSNSAGPTPDYFTLADQWTIACSIFTFAVLIEFVLVYSGVGQTETPDYELKNCLIGESDEKKKFSGPVLVKQMLSHISQSTNPLDMVSRVVFPLIFVIFCGSYCCQISNAV